MTPEMKEGRPRMGDLLTLPNYLDDRTTSNEVQSSLFDPGYVPQSSPVTTLRKPVDDIQLAFEAFDNLNPSVYDQIVEMTRELMRNGHRKVGIAMIWEVLRWERMLATDDPASDYRLNNNYKSRYARKIMRQEPDLVDVYEVRELKA